MPLVHIKTVSSNVFKVSSLDVPPPVITHLTRIAKYFFYSGLIDINAIECITSVEGIVNFHWHIMCHDFADRLRKAKAANPNFSR